MGFFTLMCIVVIMSIMMISPFYNGEPPEEDYKVLLESVAGYVDGGNFSYWQLGHAGPLLIELKSLIGDADIYVSDELRPTYELGGNNLSSTTCGLDIVHIPSEFPRPIGVGIFGHWSYETSRYFMQVYLDSDLRNYSTISLDSMLKERGISQKYIGENMLRQQEMEQSTSVLSDMVFNALGMLFELFIL